MNTGFCPEGISKEVSWRVERERGRSVILTHSGEHIYMLTHLKHLVSYCWKGRCGGLVGWVFWVGEVGGMTPREAIREETFDTGNTVSVTNVFWNSKGSWMDSVSLHVWRARTSASRTTDSNYISSTVPCQRCPPPSCTHTLTLSHTHSVSTTPPFHVLLSRSHTCGHTMTGACNLSHTFVEDKGMKAGSSFFSSFFFFFTVLLYCSTLANTF